MWIISRRALRDFWELHPQSREPLLAWFRVMERSNFAEFNSLKAAFHTADYVAPYTIFNIGGNKFRLITAIHYNRKRIYIRHVFTHPEYDRWSVQSQRGKRRKGRQ